jgi:hypothetical protein
MRGLFNGLDEKREKDQESIEAITNYFMCEAVS